MPIYPYSFTLPPVNKQDIPSDGVVGEFLGINSGGQLDWLPVSGGGGTGDMLKADNLSGLASYPTARTNLGLGTGDSPTFANLTLTSPSLSSSAPVTISQTWNGTGSTVFTALKVDATTPGTTSAFGSLLLDLQVGGVSKFSVNKAGEVSGYSYIGLNSSGGVTMQVAAANASFGYHMAKDYCVTWGGNATLNGSIEVSLCRDGAANTLALRNGAAAQTFNVYGTSSSSNTVYERMFARYDGTALAFQVGTQHLGATARPLQLLTDNAARMTIGTTGNVGIGTTAPRTRLHLEDTASPFVIEVSGSTIPNFTGVGFGPALGNNTNLRVSPINATWGGTSISAFSANQNSVPVFNFEAHHGSTSPTTPAFGFFSYKHNGSTGRTAFGANEISYQFSNASTQLLTVLGSGNVGIGTTTPAASLHINGSSSPPALRLQQGGSNQVEITMDGNQSLFFNRNNVNQVVFSYLNNVGIGTTAPSSKLEVAGLITATGIAANGTSSPRTYALGDSTSTRGLEFFTGGSALYYREGSAAYFALYTGGVKLASNSSIGWCATSPDGNPDTILLRDGETDHLAMRRTTNGQKFSVYGTYPGAAWERFTITAPTSGNVLLGTYKGTGGIARGLEFQTDGVTRLTIGTGGDVNLSNALVFGGSGQFRFLSSGVAFLTNAAQTDFGRLCLGGNTASFPAIKRSTVRIQAVLANDSGFTNIQGKLTTDTDYTATVVTPTGFLTLYDAQGNAYKVPCVAA